MPAYLNAISGDGVHIVTVNDYLAKRDAEQMGRVHRFLGLKVGVILSDMKPDDRRAAYGADITYGTNNEFGFDYLRDNMAHRKEERVQGGTLRQCRQVNPSSSTKRVHLIISGPADDASTGTPNSLVSPRSWRKTPYEVDIRKRTVGVREAGVALVEDQLGINNMYEVASASLVGYLNNAVRAKELFHCDEDYIVTDQGEVMIVDEFTGRVLVGRQ